MAHWTLTPPATAPTATPAVLIPGWSVGSDIFAPLLPVLRQSWDVCQADLTALTASDTVATVVEQLAQTLTAPTWLIGWSLGGNIAIELAARYPEKVLGLCVLGTSPSFVQREDWPAGMDPQEFARFAEGVQTQPTKTLKRFDALQVRGDRQAKNLQKFLRDYRRQQHLPAPAALSRSLALLAEFDQREKIKTLRMPLLWCFGDQDQLVARGVAQAVRRLLPRAELKIFPATAHLPFLSHPEQLCQRLQEIVQRQTRWQNKQKVAAAFSRAAESYDAAAHLQHWAGGQLLQWVTDCPGILLDAGCGTAYWTTRLAERAQQVLALDLAPGMLRYSQARYPHSATWLGGDLEHLPLAEASLEAIFSSLAVQWCDSVAGFLREWYRVLQPGGKVYLATLGPQTLCELRESFAAVTSYQHVNQFVPAAEVSAQAEHAGFSLRACQVKKRILRYQQLPELLRDLKNIGAHTVLGARMPGLLGKGRFQKIAQAYAAQRDSAGCLPATYEVIFLCWEKPERCAAIAAHEHL